MSRLSNRARGVVKRVVRAASSAATSAAGVDVSDRIIGRPALVVAPHPDDETLGCGATIARLRESGDTVHVVLVTGGGASPRPSGMGEDEFLGVRRAESRRALSILGVDPACVLDLEFADGSLEQHQASLGATFSRLLARIDVGTVLVASAADRHPDHAATARAVRAAVLRAERPPVLLEYPIWQRVPVVTMLRQSAAGLLRGGDDELRPLLRPRLVSSRPFLTAKREAIQAYPSQLPHFPIGFVEDFLRRDEVFLEFPARQR